MRLLGCGAVESLAEVQRGGCECQLRFPLPFAEPITGRLPEGARRQLRPVETWGASQCFWPVWSAHSQTPKPTQPK